MYLMKDLGSDERKTLTGCDAGNKLQTIEKLTQLALYGFPGIPYQLLVEGLLKIED